MLHLHCTLNNKSDPPFGAWMCFMCSCSGLVMSLLWFKREKPSHSRGERLGLIATRKVG
ncbi:hypothetical protein [Rubritalea tangerina]|uniref:hypothetical protein n=1 Tax=Rubritalea tangerina TaxID=430798 RepID=UPI00360D5278